MEYVRKLFETMIERDVFVWNTLIRGYTDQGPCREAIALYRTMHQIGVLPNNYTFPFVVRSCGVLLALIEGKEVHCNITKIGFVQHVCSKWAYFKFRGRFWGYVCEECSFLDSDDCRLCA